MKLAKAHELMVQDGAPAILFLSQEERLANWINNPPKAMPSFHEVKAQDPAAQKVLEELEEMKKTKGKNRIAKMLAKKEDHTGMRWDTMKSKWVPEMERTMISITTNSRGATQMPTKKDHADMTSTELVDAYNKISGKPPIKKFSDRKTALARLASAETAKAAAAKAKTKTNGATKSETKPKEGSANKRAAEFGARVGTNREKLLIALDEHFKKQISIPDLLKAVYGSKNLENVGSLTMVLKGAETMIEKNKLPYTLKKEKNAAKEISYGLYSK